MSGLPPAEAAHTWSLRNRLMALLLVMTIGLWVLASTSMYLNARYQSQRLFDDSLRETAHLLLTVVQHEMAEHGVDYTGQLIDAADVPNSRYLRFQIWTANHQLIYRTPDAPLTPLSELDGVGYAQVTVAGEAFRTFVVWNAERNLQIQIADSVTHRNEVIVDIMWSLLAFGAVFLPITLFLIWWIVDRSFAPLRWVTDAVAQRSARQLDEVDPTAVPNEIAPLIHALNALLRRIREAMQHERRFTADAAHELRTPLAAVRAHAQVLQHARSPEEAQEAAHDIVAGVDRSRRLVDQLLALARVDQVAGHVHEQHPIDLGELASQQVRDHLPLAEKMQVTLQIQAPSLWVRAHGDQLHILLRNLIDNALRYTPSGGRVLVEVGRHEHSAYLAVRDNGHGIPEAERARIFERFYRIRRVEQNHAFGSGLGLSIVQRLVELHGARLSLEPGLDARGVSFVVSFALVSDNAAASPQTTGTQVPWHSQ